MAGGLERLERVQTRADRTAFFPAAREEIRRPIAAALSQEGAKLSSGFLRQKK